ncbi:hypothetical protein DSL64_02055 [Dyadobacter luteus]|uniref:Outer membrane protein beta-barrel domain-containing protein n=1 Tax=Dyadobacter luteus TaxID=2259619 RepID=A0A3D8YIE8_9BACT|nr:outer membrane beta-barrel family protein [Dyadobacter luteus]REA64357.1 hypothetical protein DSL64_02055 [Dyadobacter luteus]
MRQLLLCLLITGIQHNLLATKHCKEAYYNTDNRPILVPCTGCEPTASSQSGYQVYEQESKYGNDSTYRITGKVVDAQTNAPLTLASISLMQNDSSSTPLKMALTNELGEFGLEDNRSRTFLHISFVGYENVVLKIKRPEGSVLYLGNIKLTGASNVLNQVIVNAKKPALEMITGGYRFNASNNIIGAGANMAEMLKQIPGLLVDDLQGKIELLGKTPSVLINGRKVNITGTDLLTYLRSLPSNEILSVNVLTNPGAEYDASGGGGILDIRLKKSKQVGFFGSASAGVSTLWRTDQSVNLNLKLNKIDVSLGYNFGAGKNLYRRNDVIKNYMLADTSYLFLQNQRMNEFQRSHSIRTNITYNIDTTSAVSVNYWYAHLYNHTPNHRNADILSRGSELQRRLQQNDTNILNNDFKILDAVYDKDFGVQNKLSVGLNYSSYKNHSFTSFNRQAYNIDGSLRNSAENENRFFTVHRPYRIWTVNADYNRRLNSHYEIKFGAHYKTAQTQSGFKSFENQQNAVSSIDDRLSSDIEYHENIKSVYSTFSGNYTRFSFNAGLRLESFDYTLISLTDGAQIKNKYTNLFPNASVRYESKNKNSSVSLSANRRIDRPGYSLLNPFVRNDNIGFVSSGNPNLRPYFTNRFDVQLSQSIGNDHSVILAVYTSSSKDIFSRITRYNQQLGTPEINSYNDYNIKQAGSYLMLNNRFGSKLNVSTYLSLQKPGFSSKVPADFLLPGITNFMGNINAFVNVLPKTTIQVFGFYTSNRHSFQTKNGATGYITLGAQQKILSDKVTIALNFEDIFNTQQYPVSLQSDFLLMESLNKLTTRYLRLNLTYNFGQSFKSRQSRKADKDSRVN